MKAKKVLLLLCAACLLTGCQRTEAESVPTSGADYSFNQKALIAEAEQGSGVPLSQLPVPERFTGEWTGLDGFHHVTADAPILLPEVTAVPVAKVSRRDFDQENIDQLLSAFLDGGTLYKEVYPTKQHLQEYIEELEAKLRGELPYTADGTVERLPELIAYYRELLKTALDENDRIPVEPSLSQVDDGINREELRGWGEADGKIYHLSITNDAGESYSGVRIYQEKYDPNEMLGGYENDWQQRLAAAEMALSKEDAIQVGDALMEKLGLESAQCSYMIPAVFRKVEGRGSLTPTEQVSGYVMEYVRTVAGMPIQYTGEISGSTDENDHDSRSWHIETITLGVSEDGIAYFYWYFQYTQPKIQTEDARLIPFEDAADVFGEMLFVKNSFWRAADVINGFDTFHEYHIDRVELNLMRLRNATNYSQGLIVPVWDFWGTEKAWTEEEAWKPYVSGEEHYGILLTVNAVDGTMVDRRLGY